MQFSDKEYYQAATERIQQAVTIHDTGNSYALSMYCSGLAVECLLRAFRWKKDKSFEGRHDLKELLKASGIIQIDEELLKRKRNSEEKIAKAGSRLPASLNLVVVLWHNNLRFASEERLETFLKNKNIDRLKGIKGDALKKNSSDLLSAAQAIINRGIVLWTSKTK